MGLIQRIVKPHNRRSKRLLKNKEPKIYENVKQTLFVKGRKTHNDVVNFMKQIALLKKPDAISLSKKALVKREKPLEKSKVKERNKKHNKKPGQLTEKYDASPFEDFEPMERLCRKYDASMFVFASHSKKRPNNLVIGRTFDHERLDTFELGVDSFQSLNESSELTPSVGIKPALVFVGEEFETDYALRRLKSMLIDLLHQKGTDIVHMANVEYVITFVYVENKILMRTYRISTKNVGEKAARVDLSIMGPSADLTLRRHTLAPDNLFKKSMKKPKTKGKKIKSVRRDAFGSKLGRVHMTSQDVNKLQTRKMKGLKKTAKEKKAQKEARTATQQ